MNFEKMKELSDKAAQESAKNKVSRKETPHHATITLKIDVRKMNKDGSLERSVLGNEVLNKYNISNKAQVCISGATQADCIENLKQMLEKLNG